MIYLSLAGCVVVFLLSKPNNNVLIDPLTIFFIGILYYGFFIPISMDIYGDNRLPFLDGYLYVSNDDIEKISYLLFGGYTAFVIGWRIFVPKSTTDAALNKMKIRIIESGDGGRITIICMFLVFLFICLSVFKNQLNLIFSDYQDKILSRYENPSFSLIYNLSIITLTVLFCYNILTSRRFIFHSISYVLFLMILSFLTYSKDPMVLAGILCFSTGARAFKISQIYILFAGIVGGIAFLAFFVPAFAFYRSTGQISFDWIGTLPLADLFSDARGPFSTIVLAVRGENSVQLASLLQSFILWIPRGVWPDRPLDAAEDFARLTMPNWQPGYGLGFSPFAEATLRFGLVLSPMLLFLAGISFSIFQRIVAKLLQPTILPASLLIVHGSIMFTLQRGAFSAIFSNLTQFWIPYFFLYSLFISLSLFLKRATGGATNVRDHPMK
ncbi:MAG: hypothetical protein J0I98_21180 [Mesorhizobium sp.]|nr:hypothetical protein [Mesorhizobium sp.]MBN9245297.1 hypothetical protein [Mesorhizobium sp.]